jgi:transcriptional repressor NrdR
MERIEVRLPLVVKKDGTREPFDREKLRAGVAIACRKRPVPAATIDRVVQSVVDCLVGGASELPSEEVGKTVLEALQPVDLVAFVRFASVYREVQGPRDFVALLQPWLDEESA